MAKNLLEILETKQQGKSLVYDLGKMRKKAEFLLPKIIETFPDYTEHGIRHSERILDILNLILSDNLKEELNEYEIFFLVSAAYFHDIGMVNFPEIATNSKITNNTIAIATEIRENHHVRSELFVTKNFGDQRLKMFTKQIS